ncbi:DUF317 domain-containing protein [Kitasatospora purpeofusca]|uniref:DUF317 domain-containing protein n=1 Tax=Kitasatospora purpeofusca TaxID=67352 RepID=UPI0035E3B3E0
MPPSPTPETGAPPDIHPYGRAAPREVLRDAHLLAGQVAVRPLALAGAGTAPTDLGERLIEDHVWNSLRPPDGGVLLTSPCMRMMLELGDFAIGNSDRDDNWLLTAHAIPGAPAAWWALFSPQTPYELTTAFVLGAAELLATDPDTVLADRSTDDVVGLFTAAGWHADHGPYRTAITSPGGDTTVAYFPEAPHRSLTFMMNNTSYELLWEITVSPTVPDVLLSATAAALADEAALRRPDEIPAHHARRISVEPAPRQGAALARTATGALRTGPAAPAPPRPQPDSHRRRAR